MSVSLSVREAVLVKGVLKGMGTESACLVRAVKVSLSKLDIWEYVSANIVEAPASMPTGEYEVSFEARKMRVKKTAQGWVEGYGQPLVSRSK